MTDRGSGFPPIEDYALIGDCGSAALVSRDGAIEWLCWPGFDSPSLLAAVLDRDRGGAFRLGPVGEARRSRRYLPGTNVLETRFETASGRLRLRDGMALTDEEGALWPEHQILREVVCTEGHVDVALHFAPRFDYGGTRRRVEDRGSLGCFFQHRGGVVVLRSEIPLCCGSDAVEGLERLEEGERRMISLSYDFQGPAAIPPLGEPAARRLEHTATTWKAWSDRCQVGGHRREVVVRSALTLKLLTAAASGAVVAAPTTSLPERIGGVRNWDYRYCWLRDASFTLRALFETGYLEEGEAFFSWLLYTTRHAAPQLNVLYSVFGGSGGRERELDHLTGYCGSRPVRVGNRAEDQLQLDVYGSVVSTAFEFVQRGGRLSRWHAGLLGKLARAVCESWQRPDEGIWEIRRDRRRHTHSAAMCWVALDRLLKLEAAEHLRLDRPRLEAERNAIAAAIEREGWNDGLGSYVSWFGGDEVDASLLLLGLYGYTDPASPRMRGTFARIEERLGHDGLLHRYPSRWDDGLPPGEGAFGICSFWAVELLARRGDLDEARRRFQDLLSHANDVGLYAEEIDAATGAALGNFPQAFTHVGLISAALALEEMEGRRGEAGLEGRRPVEPPGRGGRTPQEP